MLIIFIQPTDTDDGHFRTVAIGRFGSFFANELIDQAYGCTFELLDKRLKIVPARTLADVGKT